MRNTFNDQENRILENQLIIQTKIDEVRQRNHFHFVQKKKKILKKMQKKIFIKFFLVNLLCLLFSIVFAIFILILKLLRSGFIFFELCTNDEQLKLSYLKKLLFHNRLNFAYCPESIPSVIDLIKQLELLAINFSYPIYCNQFNLVTKISY